MSVKCTVCLEEKTVKRADDRLNLYICSACNHTFTLKPKEEQERYEDAYFLEKHTNWFANPNTGLFKFVHRQVRKHMGDRRLKLMDVGCGNGAMLKYFSGVDGRLELHGIDSIQNTHPGVRFISGDLFHAEITERFDVVTSLMTIEHVDDPRLFIEKNDQWLLPGGLYVISTNNTGGLLYRLAEILKFFGMRVAYDRIYSDHHLNHFTNRSLRRILELYGFEVLTLKNHNYPLRAVDTPPAGPWVKKLYLLILAGFFAVSDIFGNGFLQTYVCRKKPA